MSEELEQGQSHPPTEECDGFCGGADSGMIDQLEIFVSFGQQVGPMINWLAREVDLFTIEHEFRLRDLHDAADLAAAYAAVRAAGVALHENRDKG